MPYIPASSRPVYERGLMRLNTPKTPGDLNYVISRIVKAYIRGQGKSYRTLNDVIGVLDGAKMEFYRRTVAPYEDTKIQENGDIA